MADQALVMIVDDQPHVLLTLEYLVKMIDKVNVITADNGEDAVALAVAKKPNLLLMDVMMPRLDGYTACKTIREQWADHPGQIWFITARDRNTDVDQARQVGANRLINKPFDPDGILKQIREELARQNTESHAA